MSFTLENLDQRIAARMGASPDESYTAKLLKDGVERCARNSARRRPRSSLPQ